MPVEARSPSKLMGCYQSPDCLWEPVVFPEGCALFRVKTPALVFRHGPWIS